MHVRFWGTRGSLPKPGPETLQFGGNTPCVEVRTADETLVIIDCGTGLHGLGQALLRSGKPVLKGHILISHTHWDHIQGIPFFAPFFVPGNEWDIYARGAQAVPAGYAQDRCNMPISPCALTRWARIISADLTEGKFRRGHPRQNAMRESQAVTLGFRLKLMVPHWCADPDPFPSFGFWQGRCWGRIVGSEFLCSRLGDTRRAVHLERMRARSDGPQYVRIRCFDVRSAAVARWLSPITILENRSRPRGDRENHRRRQSGTAPALGICRSRRSKPGLKRVAFHRPGVSIPTAPVDEPVALDGCEGPVAAPLEAA
jgi:hypothetical protein